MVDKNHNPRKGTETSCKLCLTPTTTHDKNHNPRKGTETPLFRHRLRISAILIRTIIPARGRKQYVCYFYSVIRFVPIRTIIPARGRKLPLITFFRLPYRPFDKNHNPRKGTETLLLKRIFLFYFF